MGYGLPVVMTPVAAEGTHARPDADALIAWVKSELGSVKAPKHIWLVPQLARNAAGKVSRAGVRDSVRSASLGPPA